MYDNQDTKNPSSVGRSGPVQVLDLRNGGSGDVSQADPAGAESSGMAGFGSGAMGGNPSSGVTTHEGVSPGRDSATIDFANLNDSALPLLQEILDMLGLDTKVEGNEILFINPRRQDNDFGSAKINSESGLWADFAAGADAKGGGLVSFIAYTKKCSPRQAAGRLRKLLASLDDPTKAKPQAQAKGKKTKIQAWTPIIPVPADAPARLDSHFKFGAPSKVWVYNTAEGEVVGLACRFDQPGGRKEVMPQTYCQDQVGNKAWRWQGLPEPRPLYNLDQLSARPDAPVLVCEGEKAADAAAQLLPDHVCVTSSNGAKSAGKSDWSPLLGRVVSIWPDNDEPGRAYAEEITKLLRKHDEKAEVSVMKPIVQSPGKSDAGEPILVDGFTVPDGWDAADAVEAGWTAEHVRLLGPEAFGAVTTDTSYWISEFRVSDQGVQLQKITRDGETEFTPVCSRLDVVALSRDSHNQNWGLLLEFKDSDNVLHRWSMPKEMLAGGNTYRAQLLNLGLDISPSNTRGDFLAEYLQAAKPTARALSVSQPGWYRGVFVMPNGIIGNTNEIVALQTSDPTGANIFKQQGSLLEWQQQVAALCQGNSRLVLSVCAALTGPVLHHCQQESGGFHLVGGSSIGKTTSLEVAASVWGSREFVRSWRTTGNALEAVATRHNDTLLVLDEMSQVDANAVWEIAYMLGNGQGKGRASRSGGARSVASWRLIYLSTGEVSLADHLASGNKRLMAGQEVRLVNLQADAGAGLGLFENIHGMASPQLFSGALKEVTTEHYGYAGPAFIEALADEATREQILDQVNSDSKCFEENYVPVGACGQVIRVAKRFALVAAVGEAAIRRGLLPWPEGEATHAAHTCFSTWLSARGGIANLEASQAIAQVQRFLELHGETRFTLWDEHYSSHGLTHSRTFNRAGFRKITQGYRAEYYVFPEVFRTEICDGLNAREVSKFLMESNLLLVGSDGKPQKAVRLPGMDNRRMYHLSADIMGTLQEEESEETVTQG